MSDVRQESPFVGVLSSTAAGDTGSPGVVLTERPFLGYVNLRGDAGDAPFLAAVEGVLDMGLPVDPNTIAEGEDITVCWMGPDEWLLVLRPGAQTRCVTDLREALGEHHASAVDTTGGYTLVNVPPGAVRPPEAGTSWPRDALWTCTPGAPPPANVPRPIWARPESY